MKKQNGITLIALVISIIVMLILAGVSINAVVGNNGVLSRAQYALFMNKMATVEEALTIWRTGDAITQVGKEIKSVPANGLCKGNDLNNSERLKGEIGYYRTWYITQEKPTFNIMSDASSFNSKFESEFVFYPAGVQDLYYLNNEALGINDKDTYLIDASTGIIYSINGISLKGVRCYSTYMAKSINSDEDIYPIFAETEVSGSVDKVANVGAMYLKDKNGNYIDKDGNIVSEENKVINENGFQIIAESSNKNLYKLYNNGNLYAKGEKGILLNSSSDDMNAMGKYEWTSSLISSEIPGALDNSCVITIGYDTVYAIDKNGYLWAWGDNSFNKMGLSEEEQINFSTYVPQKLNIDGKKIKKVFGTNWATFVITQDNLLYASGGNLHGELGIGTNCIQTNKFEKIDFPEDPNNIKEIGNQNSGYETNQGEGFSFILTNNKLYFCGRCSTRCSGVKLLDYSSNPDLIMKWTEVDINTMFPGLICSKAHISGSQQWWEQPYWYFYQNNLCYKMYVNGNVSKVDDFSDGTSLQIWSVLNDGSLIKIEKNETTKYYCSIGPNVVNSLGTVDAEGKLSYAQGTYDVTNAFKELEVDGKTITDIWSNISTNIVKMSNGEYYGCGLAYNLGINDVSGQKTWQRLIGLEKYGNILEFPKSQQSLLLKTPSGELVATNKLKLNFGEKVLEKSWVLIQEDVKLFNASTDGYTFAFVGTDGYLYVRGTRSNHLGLNKIDQNIDILTKVDGAGATEEVVDALKTGVKKYFIRTDAIYILTNNNKLLISCYNYRGKINSWGALYYGLNNEEHPELVIMSEDVLDFEVAEMARGIVRKTDGIYTWGMARNGYLNTNSKTLVKIENEDVWKGAGNWLSIKASLSEGFLIGENYIVSHKSNGIQLNFDEKIIKVAGGAAWLFLSNTGKIYGFGESKYLGDGQGNFGTSVKDIKLINDQNKYVDIVCGANFAIAYTSDGQVYGTGINELGILGRWKGAPRNSGLYRTAFEWVECPELEI